MFILAAKATDLGDGTWHYEYALQNLNSDRSGQALSVPILDGCAVENIGFHDIDHHSGEPYDPTDWTVAVDSAAVTWSTDTYDSNANANALRWGTVYNFRFDTAGSPGPSIVTLRLFKPGSPAEVTAATIGPAGPRHGDFSGDCVILLDDVPDLTSCLQGPGSQVPVGCGVGDADDDLDLDLRDIAAFQRAFGGG